MIWKANLISLALSLALCSYSAFAVQNSTELLNQAREYRSGSESTGVNLVRASNFYHFVIEAEIDHLPEALFELSEILDENPLLSRKYTSFNLLVRAADAGHKEAQHKLSIIYATGVSRSELIPMDASRSLLLEYFSALSGNPEAAIGMGYRFLTGLAVTSSCEQAQHFYEYAANEAAEFLEEQGYATFIDRIKLSDSVDPNARRADTSPELVDWYAHLAESGDSNAAVTLGNIYYAGTRQIPHNEEKAVYYYTLAAAEKNPAACGQLGYLMAKKYQRYLDKGGITNNIPPEQMQFIRGYEDVNDEEDEEGEVFIDFSEDLSSSSVASQAIKRFFMNTTRIHELLAYASAKGDPSGGVGLGFLHMNGIHVKRNYTAAVELFHRFINFHSDAGYYLGEIHMGHGGRPNLEINIHNAIQGYTMSSQMGNILATHRVAQMTSRGMGTSLSCASATAGFKSVAEKGPWARGLNLAHKAFQEGRKQESLYRYTQLAAIGYEVAQYNVAYLLTHGQCPALYSPLEEDLAERYVHYHPDEEVEESEGSGESKSVTVYDPRISNKVAYLSPFQWHKHIVTSNTSSPALIVSNRSRSSVSAGRPSAAVSPLTNRLECEQRALTLFALSASQGNSESYLQLGDFYYYGMAGLPVSHIEAAVYYQQAADLKHTQAIFNLGLMHEVGDGVTQDFHLAKRYYDLAAETDPKAKVVRDIALVLLEAHKSLDEMLGLESTSHLLASIGIDNSNYMQSLHLTLSTVSEYDQWFRALLDQLISERQAQVNEVLSQIRTVYESWVLFVKQSTGYDVLLQQVEDRIAEIKADNNRLWKEAKVSLSGGALKGMSGANRKELEAMLAIREEEMMDYATLAALMLMLTVLLFIRYMRFLHRMRLNRMAQFRDN